MPDFLEVIIRSFVLLIVLFFLTKWMGKKNITQFTAFEYITAIVLGAIIAIHSFDIETNITYGIIALVIWFTIPYSAKLLSLKNKSFRDLTKGKSTVFIKDGKIMEDNLKMEGYSTDDLLQQLRNKDFFHVTDVEFALLEPSGALNVLPKKEVQPITAKVLGLKVNPEKEPQTVIMDGHILLEPLATLSLNPLWLKTEMEKINVSIENVFLGQVDSDGQLTVDLYDDKIVVPSPSEKPLLLATLKKCQADLELFSLATNNERSKQMYDTNSNKLQQAINIITPYLNN